MTSPAPSHAYRCSGLTLVSDLELPELIPAELRPGESADVRIASGSVAPGGLVSGRQIGPYLWVTPRQLWLQVPGVARFLIEDGDRKPARVNPASMQTASACSCSAPPSVPCCFNAVICCCMEMPFGWATSA